MATEIIFTALGANSQFGSFGPGDRMRCAERLAKHLVEEIGVAKYAAQPASAADALESSGRRRGRK